MDPEIIKQFEDQYGVKVTETYFESYDVMYPRILAGNSGFDLTFPTDTDIPGLVAEGLLVPLDLSLIPNVENLAAEWADPGLRPRPQALDAVHVVDDGLRLRLRAGRRGARPAWRPCGTRASTST